MLGLDIFRSYIAGRSFLGVQCLRSGILFRIVDEVTYLRDLVLSFGFTEGYFSVESLLRLLAAASPLRRRCRACWASGVIPFLSSCLAMMNPFSYSWFLPRLFYTLPHYYYISKCAGSAVFYFLFSCASKSSYGKLHQKILFERQDSFIVRFIFTGVW